MALGGVFNRRGERGSQSVGGIPTVVSDGGPPSFGLVLEVGTDLRVAEGMTPSPHNRQDARSWNLNPLLEPAPSLPGC